MLILGSVSKDPKYYFGVELRALPMLGKYSTTLPHPQTLTLFLSHKNFFLLNGNPVCKLVKLNGSGSGGVQCAVKILRTPLCIGKSRPGQVLWGVGHWEALIPVFPPLKRIGEIANSILAFSNCI
jgi:hypothetical protein